MIYDSIHGAFTRTANMPRAHEVHAGTHLSDGTILIAGGFAPWPALGAGAEIHDPAVLVPSPRLFSVSGDGRGQSTIPHANTSQLALPDNPSAVAESPEICLTGLMADGAVPPRVVVGGRMAEVLWFGIAPGPAVPVWLSHLGRPSNVVTIGVSRP